MHSRFTLLYTLLFACLAFVNRYDQWLSLPPVSVHQWRQADGAAIAWNYTQQPFFTEPRINNRFYTNDPHTVGELPLLYWLAGAISRYTAHPAYPLRWLGLLLLYAGGWALGWILLRVVRRPDLAAMGALLMLSAPVLGYYGPSTLPDAPAWCLILVALAFLFRADQLQSPRWLTGAGVCAATAILLKISMAILPMALTMTWLKGRRQKRWPAGSLWAGRWPPVILAGIFLTVVSGRLWITAFKTTHKAIYFLDSTRPIWNYDAAYVWESLGLIGRNNLPVFGSVGLYLAAGAGLVLLLQRWRSAPPVWKALLVFTMQGSLGYSLLWFRMLREHDYYFLCLLALPALLLLFGLQEAVRQYPTRQIRYLLAGLLLFSLAHSHWVMSGRLEQAYHPPTSENLPPESFLPAAALRTAGIPDTARFLCPQDPSPNIALLALQRTGWTAYNFGDRITADTLNRYQQKYGLTHLALRDTALYGPLYERFFPQKLLPVRGWFFYRKRE
ncbi:MAG: hypothetical protein EP344_18675 [Bacteroidetes bacterium]|nr:MAG: hypothetical protein EP344_18675 [Bacteroidota bacterium]